MQQTVWKILKNLPFCIKFQFRQINYHLDKIKTKILCSWLCHIANYIHCPPIVWNYPSSGSVLLSLNGANFFKEHLAIPILKHIENMFIHTYMFSMCLKFGVARHCLKKMAPFKHNNKKGALLGRFHTIIIIRQIEDKHVNIFYQFNH